MLESLRIRNFKRHEALDIVFPSGMTICTGKNYQGKSTILQAILFAFFGVSAVPGGSKLVVKRGTPQSSMSAELTFFHRGQRYRLERSFNNAALYADNSLIASSKSAVNAQLEEIFGTPQKFFMRLKYAEQGQTQALLTMGAEELHKIVEHVSGASTVNEVIAKASKRATAASNRLDELGPAADTTSLEEQLNQLVTAKDKTTEHLNLKATEVKFATDMLSEAEKHLDEMFKHNAAVEKALAKRKSEQIEYEAAKGDIAQCERTLKEYQSAADVADNMAAKLKNLRETEATFKKIQADHAKYNERVGDYERALQERQAALRQLETEFAAIPEVHSGNLKELYDHVMFLIGAHAKKIEEVQRLREDQDTGVCSACGRPFEHFDPISHDEKLKNAVAEEIELMLKKEEEGAKYEALMAQYHKRKKLFDDIGAMNTQVQGTVDGLNYWIDQRGTSFEALSSMNPPTGLQMQAAEEDWRRTQLAASLCEEAQIRLDLALTTATRLGQTLSTEHDIPDTYNTDEQRQEILNLRDAKAKSEREKSLAEMSLMKVKNDISTTSNTLAAAQQKASRAAQLTKDKETAQRLVKYLKTNRDRFMSQLWGQVANYASDFASACTGGAIERVIRTDTGTFEFVEDGQTAPLEAASGAQKSIMSVGVQLAFDALLPDSFGALMLDEPTSQMDEDHALALSQMLANSGRQIIMVSHRENDAALAQAHVHLN